MAVWVEWCKFILYHTVLRALWYFQMFFQWVVWGSQFAVTFYHGYLQQDEECFKIAKLHYPDHPFSSVCKKSSDLCSNDPMCKYHINIVSAIWFFVGSAIVVIIAVLGDYLLRWCFYGSTPPLETGKDGEVEIEQTRE